MSNEGFSVKVVADSINPDGNRIISYLLTYPRFIHSELMTHRVFSRNAASSRAIPIDKVISQVRNNPAMPVRWGRNGKGMQDHGELAIDEARVAEIAWRAAANRAADEAENLKSKGLHKQIVNRVLEPFVWMTTLVTATEWENFYSLRLHKDAQPEFQHLCVLMLEAHVNSNSIRKEWDEWHIPFGDQMPDDLDNETKLKIATARAARTSYLTMDGQTDVSKDTILHERLAESGHWSPFEHSAKAQEGRHANFNGWLQYRHTFSNESRKCNLNKLLSDFKKGI